MDNTIENKWAVDVEICRSGNVKYRVESCTFETSADAIKLLNNCVQKWRMDKSIKAYLARLLVMSDGQWVPVVVRHDCRRSVMRSDAQINAQQAAGGDQNAEPTINGDKL